MESIRIIPTWLHGAIDYIVGVLLILAPFLFGFSDLSGAVVLVPYLLGAAIIIWELCARHELGLLKLVPMPYHLAIDFLAGLFLALSPWLFQFSDLDASAWYPHLIVGILIIIVTLLSQVSPRWEA